MKKLPIFNGYTVDFRLREFRKAQIDATGAPCEVDFIPFASAQGRELLMDFIVAGYRSSAQRP